LIVSGRAGKNARTLHCRSIFPLVYSGLIALMVVVVHDID
jgi:hypothetical protein